MKRGFRVQGAWYRIFAVCWFLAPAMALGQQAIERLDPAIDALLPRDARLEELVRGFSWSEGPVWRPRTWS